MSKIYVEDHQHEFAHRLYLGDGVYVGVDPTGYCVWLWTINGDEVTNAIGLESSVLDSFRDWQEAVQTGVDNDED